MGPALCEEQEKFRHVDKQTSTFQIQHMHRKWLESSFPADVAGLKIPGSYYSAYDAAMAITKCAPYPVTGISTSQQQSARLLL